MTENNGRKIPLFDFFFYSLKVFHTRNKQGVVIHPTSVFASDPEVLHVPEDENRETGKDSLSVQILVKNEAIIKTNCTICSS